MHLITDSLLVGTIDDAHQPPAVVGHLLLVAEEFHIQPPQWVTFARVPLKEYAGAEPLSLCQAVDWIEEHVLVGRVMVCCRAGLGRSVSVVIAYLCCVQNMPYEESVKLAKARRPGATPLPNLEMAIREVRRIRQDRTSSPNFQPMLPQNPPSCA